MSEFINFLQFIRKEVVPEATAWFRAKIETPEALLRIFVGIFVLSIVMFLWDEDLTFHAKINHEKFASFFTVIAAIGTTISIFLLYRQVKIMAEQHESASTPILVFEKTFFNATQTGSNDFSITTITGTMPFMMIKNLGKSIALDIHMSWVAVKIGSGGYVQETASFQSISVDDSENFDVSKLMLAVLPDVTLKKNVGVNGGWELNGLMYYSNSEGRKFERQLRMRVYAWLKNENLTATNPVYTVFAAVMDAKDEPKY